MIAAFVLNHSLAEVRASRRTRAANAGFSSGLLYAPLFGNAGRSDIARADRC